MSETTRSKCTMCRHCVSLTLFVSGGDVTSKRLYGCAIYGNVEPCDGACPHLAPQEDAAGRDHGAWWSASVQLWGNA
uniref:Uncharacterized protein n=1 Tax=viral metagenome TaxID=1070528 RepID=A0A6M3JIC0_9ZZZZ